MLEFTKTRKPTSDCIQRLNESLSEGSGLALAHSELSQFLESAIYAKVFPEMFNSAFLRDLILKPDEDYLEIERRQKRGRKVTTNILLGTAAVGIAAVASWMIGKF
jgi:hypothetical protein